MQHIGNPKVSGRCNRVTAALCYQKSSEQLCTSESGPESGNWTPLGKYTEYLAQGVNDCWQDVTYLFGGLNLVISEIQSQNYQIWQPWLTSAEKLSVVGEKKDMPTNQRPRNSLTG